MSSSDATYVIFDGDKDKWAYAYMKGWNANENMDFDFEDAHDLDNMTARAQGEQYVKSKLRERMKQAKQVIVLVGESTKHLHRFVTWEIDLALELDLAIIVVNLNGARVMDADLCPVALRKACAVHVDFKMKIIKFALDHFPAEYSGFDKATKTLGSRTYSAEKYKQLGL
jgi:hypothetical protein